MKIYVAGPMTGYANFNYPAFHAASQMLRDKGHFVFSPAERDMERDGKDWGELGQTWNQAEIKAQGFDLRTALGDDLAWICAEAEGVYMLKGWEKSSGAGAEWATAKALGLEIWYET